MGNANCIKASCLFVLLLLLIPLFAGAQVLIVENFNSGIPATWTVQNGGTTLDTWNGTTGGYQGNYLDSTEFAFVDSDAAGSATGLTLSEQLITPVFNGNPYGQILLEYDQYFRVFSQDSGFVEVFDGNNWVTVLSLGANTGSWASPDHPIINLTSYKNANMRVRFRYEDYGIWAWYWAVDNVKIHAPLANDLSVVGFLGPVSSCGLGSAEDVLLQVENLGTNTLNSFSVSYQINNGPPITENVLTSLPSGTKYTHTFAAQANLTITSSFIFDGWCNLAGDGNSLNDSSGGYLVQSLPQIASFPYQEDFESGPGDWFTGGVSPTWAYGTPVKPVIQGAASGTKAWTTGGLGVSSYANNENSNLNSPCFDFSGLTNPWIKMSIWWECEQDWDGAALQASTDFGTTWNLVGAFGDPVNWFNRAQIAAAPGGQPQGWTGWVQDTTGSGGWVEALHPLYGLAGQASVRFRMAFASDGTIVSDGVAIDDIIIADGPQLELGLDTTACDSLWVVAGGPGSKLWSTGDTLDSILVSGSSQWVKLELTDSFGFKANDSLFVHLIPTDIVDLGSDSVYCNSSGIVLDGGTGAIGWTWSTGDTSQTIWVSESGIIWVQIDYGQGCSAADTVKLSFESYQPGFILPGDTVCKGQPLLFADTSLGATNWAWDFGDGATSSIASPTHTYSSGGTFQVSLSIGNGTCIETVSQYIHVRNCVGIEHAESITWTVYPNPAHNRFRVMLPGNCRAGNFSLFDIYGRSVPIELVSGMGNVFSLETSNIKAGTYLLGVQTNFGMIYRRVILLME